MVKHIIAKRRPCYRLLWATQPEEGLAMAHQHRPDLILRDISLPGMDGCQIMEILSASEDTAGTPVIAVSANTLQSDIEKGKAAGFRDYLEKPIHVGSFLAAIDRWLA